MPWGDWKSTFFHALLCICRIQAFVMIYLAHSFRNKAGQLTAWRQGSQRGGSCTSWLWISLCVPCVPPDYRMLLVYSESEGAIPVPTQPVTSKNTVTSKPKVYFTVSQTLKSSQVVKVNHHGHPKSMALKIIYFWPYFSANFSLLNWKKKDSEKNITIWLLCVSFLLRDCWPPIHEGRGSSLGE